MPANNPLHCDRGRMSRHQGSTSHERPRRVNFSVSVEMPSLAQRLIDLAKSVETSDGFVGHFDLVDALEAKPAALARFKMLLGSAKAKQLDALEETDQKYGWL